MLKDYYSILEVSPSATKAEIKKQYRKLAKKWHPDVNQEIDTTSKMQEITEAYLILNDSEAKKRYDNEYSRFTKFKESKHRTNDQKSNTDNKRRYDAQRETNETYEVNDELLKKWINNAKKQAKDFANQAKEDTIGIGNRGIEYAKKSFWIGLIVFVVLFFLTIFLLNTNS